MIPEGRLYSTCWAYRQPDYEPAAKHKHASRWLTVVSFRAGIIDDAWNSATVSILPSKIIDCPYCGEPIELIVDDSAGEQQYVEDCSVCCRPINVEVTVDGTNGIELNCRTDNETY